MTKEKLIDEMDRVYRRSQAWNRASHSRSATTYWNRFPDRWPDCHQDCRRRSGGAEETAQAIEREIRRYKGFTVPRLTASGDVPHLLIEIDRAWQLALD